ncbi:YdcF family protein [Ramlibacter sp. WS9]|nr:YdcF family protein [Ramlibacter sp. WS9]
MEKMACLFAGVLLIADAIFLMSLGVFSVGVMLPLAMGLTLLGLGLRWTAMQQWLAARRRRRIAWRWAWAALTAWAVTVVMFWSVLARAGSDSTGAPAPAAIVVLGSGTPNGKASPVLSARLDLALKQAALYPQAIVVVSGGVDFGQTRSEAAIMGDYLRSAGLGAERIVQEERSTSTEENLLFTKPLLEQRGLTLQGPVQLVTSDFHTLRAGWIARSAGYQQVSMAGAPTPLYVRYNAWLREYFAVLLGFVRREF